MLGKLRKIVAFAHESALAKSGHDGTGEFEHFGCIPDGVGFFFCHDHALECSVSLQFDKNKAKRVMIQQAGTCDLCLPKPFDFIAQGGS
jgi:hypothetical protein